MVKSGLLRIARGSSGGRTTRPSRPRIASSLRNAIRTSTTAVRRRKRILRRSTRLTTSSRIRRSARLTTASATPRSRTAVAGKIRSAAPPASTASPTSSRRSSANSWTSRGARQNAAPRGRPSLRPRTDLRGSVHRHRRDLEIEAWRAANSCHGLGCAKAEPCSRTCATCGGVGKVRPSRAFSGSSALARRAAARPVISDPCSKCSGEAGRSASARSSVKIPAGVDEGTRIRVTGEGEAGVRGGPPATSTSSSTSTGTRSSQREGTTLFADCPVSFTTAALGGTIKVPGLDGTRRDQIPAGIQSGKQLRQRGAGMPVLNGRGRGDHGHPGPGRNADALSAKQKEIARGIPQTETGEECPATKGFFSRVREMFAG